MKKKKSNRADGRFEVKRKVGVDSNGNNINKSFYGKSKNDALQKYYDYIAERNVEEEKKKRTPFKEWASKWLEVYKKSRVKPTTYLSTYERPCKNYIIPYFNDSILQDIKQIDIIQFLNSVSNLSQSYIQKIIICLNGIFESAVDNELIDRNPCRRATCKSLQATKDKRVYGRATVEYLCNVKQKYALLVNILLRMGLRCSELCGLKWTDIDFDDGKMHVCRALTCEAGKIYIGDTKTKTSRRVLPIPPDLMEKLKEAPKPNEYIAMLNGNHITPAHFNERQLEFFYNTAKVPKDKRLTAHELRHTCGTLLYEETKDIYFVSHFLGHADIGVTTKIYVHSEMNESKIHI